MTVGGALWGQAIEPKPAFTGQAHAPVAPKSAPFETTIITEQLNSPWSLAFLPDGSFLITESAGRLRIVKPDGTASAPIEGVPGVKSVGAEGFHEIVLDPDFASNRMIYFTYLAPPPGQAPGNYPLEHAGRGTGKSGRGHGCYLWVPAQKEIGVYGIFSKNGSILIFSSDE